MGKEYLIADVGGTNTRVALANDGMLHAYDKDLNDLWAFIPPSVLPKLRNLVSESNTTNTEWLVDGPIVVKDVYINATSEWKTVLVGSLGWGGKGYYVLDITDAWNPKHLFTISHFGTDCTPSTPAINSSISETLIAMLNVQLSILK